MRGCSTSPPPPCALGLVRFSPGATSEASRAELLRGTFNFPSVFCINKGANNYLTGRQFMQSGRSLPSGSSWGNRARKQAKQGREPGPIHIQWAGQPSQRVKKTTIPRDQKNSSIDEHRCVEGPSMKPLKSRRKHFGGCTFSVLRRSDPSCMHRAYRLHSTFGAYVCENTLHSEASVGASEKEKKEFEERARGAMWTVPEGKPLRCHWIQKNQNRLPWDNPGWALGGNGWGLEEGLWLCRNPLFHHHPPRRFPLGDP